MSEPLNLDDIAASVDEPFTFVFGGEEFELPADPDVVVWEMLSTNRLQAFLMATLGDDAYARMADIPADVATMTRERLAALLEAYQKHLGIEAPKSSGPNRSYRRTAQR
jgi:hypothetical protein